MDNQSKPLTTENRQQSAAGRSAIKGDYKHWKDSLSYNDLVKYTRTCYNEYTTFSNDLSLPRDVRNSYGDRAFAFKALLEYIERQAE